MDFTRKNLIVKNRITEERKKIIAGIVKTMDVYKRNHF